MSQFNALGPSSPEKASISSDPTFLGDDSIMHDAEGSSEPGDAAMAIADSLEDPIDEIQANGFIKLNTHDVSFVEEHIPNIEKFADDLQVAINAAWPTRKKSRYENVHVLLLSWEDDNLGVELEIKRLGHVFSNLYRFNVQEFKIPRKTPGKATISCVSHFLETDAHDSLLIVYYAGHARLSHQTNEPPIWAATDKPGSPTLPSGGVQQLLEEAESDVLLLYDSCHSSHPAINVAGQGVTEVIAACGFETKAPAVGPHSFTNALIRELEESFAGPPISIAELHGKVISSLKNWKPSLLRDENGNVWTDELGRARYECHKRRTPVHCFLTNESPYRSIMLTPLQSNLSHTSVSDLDRPQSQSSTAMPDEMFHSAHSSQASSSTVPTTLSESSKPVDSLQVLLAVRLEEDYFLKHEDEDDGKKIREWCSWLKIIPDGVQNITIEGLYKSCSALVILRLPITLWDLLPDNAAYSFIGFVNSNNLVMRGAQQLASLSIPVGDLMCEKLTPAPNVPKDPKELVDSPTEHLEDQKTEMNTIIPITKWTVERDDRGRERVVRAPFRQESRSRGRSKSTLELLKEAEEREQQLKSEIMSLQTRLSSTQRERWQMANDCQQIKNFPAQFEAQAREVRRLEEMITDEEKKIESLEMKSRLVKRGKGAMDEEIRARYEEKLREIEALKQAIKAKDEQVSAAETRITDKNKTILYLKEFLRKNGFRVAD